jgi:hypothetical protein
LGGAVAFAVTAFQQRDCPAREPAALAPLPPRSTFAGFRFPPDVIVLAVRCDL